MTIPSKIPSPGPDAAPRPPQAVALQAALRGHALCLARLNRLARYFQGSHDILSRQRLSGLPNVRMSHGFPRYIAQVSAAYLLGEPVRVQGPEPATGLLNQLLTQAQADAIDVDLAMQQAIFGRAVSLNYISQGGEAFVCALDPRQAFVVYDDTVERRPRFGIRVVQQGGRQQVSVYTDQAVFDYPPGSDLSPQQARVTPHPFQQVPMVEYLNGSDQHGDFEDVLSLIDAYDLLACDRLNDRQQFSDALLVLTGVMGIGTETGDSLGAMERLRQEKTLALPDSEAKAEWLVKDPREQDIDILRAALAEDIHKFAMVPDFSDERFAGNASGIAIKYKLFNFDNRIKLKERWFITGLRERARAFCGYLRQTQGISLDADDLVFKLSRRLPMNELERAQTIHQLQEVLPRETLISNSPLPAPNSSCSG